MNDDVISLDYGSGGRKTAALIEEEIVPLFRNEALSALGDGAVLSGTESLVFSTDSFVVDPLFFPGGDIGKLSVCGTVNDLCMCGGEPKYLSCALLIEEGFAREKLRRVLMSMAAAAKNAGVALVTGDTKVVERGKGDGLYINTSGIGFLRRPNLCPRAIRPGDKVLVSGTVGDHGTAVMLSRYGLADGSIGSDCASLKTLSSKLFPFTGLRVLRDPTRGGLATTLCEFVEGSDFSIELEGTAIPVRASVRAACDMLGLDPLYCANEGKLVCVCSGEEAGELLKAMKDSELGREAAIIGTVTTAHPGLVTLSTPLGGKRILQKLSGAQLPRIC